MSERKLTEAEQKRAARFAKTVEELAAKGYTRKDLTTTGTKANLYGTLIGLLASVPFIILFIVSIILDKEGSFVYDGQNSLVLLVLMIVSIFVHEGLHGLGWSIASKSGFESIEFGFILKSLNPYCTCSKPMSRKAYIFGLLLPCFVLGVIPCIVALFNHSFSWLFMGILMIMSAGGDLLILTLILKHKPVNDEELYIDHPTNIGLAVFAK